MGRREVLREVHQAEAIEWLTQKGVMPGCSFVTSMPDFSEFPSKTLSEWKEWFIAAARRVMECCPPEGVAIFFQTDVKIDGVWIDKGYLCQRAAEEIGCDLLWHKVICRVAPGHAAFGKPGYSHLLCFSRGVRVDVAKSVLDVLPDAGEKTWTRGMGVEACALAVRFVLSHTETRTIVDPFCGHGTLLAVANELGLDAIGVELGRKRAEKARLLQAPGLRLRRTDFSGASLGAKSPNVDPG